MINSLDGAYNLEAFVSELKQRIEGNPKYLKDARYTNTENDPVLIIGGSLLYILKNHFHNITINEDAFNVTIKDGKEVVVTFDNDIVSTPAELEYFKSEYTKVMGQLPPMTMTFNKPVTRQIITIEVGK